MIDFAQFILPENPDIPEHLIATYQLRTDSADILKLVSAMASEQTIGTWVKVPGEVSQRMQQCLGKVLNIWEIPDIEQGAAKTDDCREFIFQIAYPADNVGPQLPMLLTTIFGNISMFGDIKLIDLFFPREFVEGLPGPQFGIEGIRGLLGIEERPLLNTMVKPSIGITPEMGADLLYKAAIGGTDIIKDDEVLGDPQFSPALKLYAVNITDEPERSIRKAEMAVENGANAIMINFLPAGLGLVSSLARSKSIKVPILAHLDFGGALYASPRHGISSALLYGKFARLAGVDLLTIPTPYGKFSLAYNKYIRIILGLRSQLYEEKQTFPIIGGGIKQADLPKLFQDLGPDFVVGAGGAIYAHPQGPSAGAKAFRQGIELIMKYGDFGGKETDYPELKAAIEQWGGEIGR
jgi:2,3-diketo-5-methylthiopentyl-1-phosphate enolase